MGSVTILELEGAVTAKAGSGALKEKIQQLVAQGNPQIVLECSRATALDSEGVASLVQGLTAAEKRRGKVKLLNLSPAMDRVLSVVGLLKVFESFSDESRAVASFQ